MNRAALFALALAGIVLAAWPGSATRRPVIVVLIAAAPMALAMFAAIAVSHRYTADFLGFFGVVAAFGTAGIDDGAARWRTVARCALGLLAVTGVCITLALTLCFQGTMVWGQPKETLEHYQRLRERAEHAAGWLRSL